jgi:hypothetical protein
VQLLDLIGPELILLIPRLAAQEVTRNLATPEQVSRFYGCFTGETLRSSWMSQFPGSW